MTYRKSALIYVGEARRLYTVINGDGAEEPRLLIIERKDAITKLDGEVRDNIEGKGPTPTASPTGCLSCWSARGFPLTL